MQGFYVNVAIVCEVNVDLGYGISIQFWLVVDTKRLYLIQKDRLEEERILNWCVCSQNSVDFIDQ